MPTTLKTTRIYKKINSNPDYWLYHPQTGGNQVLINSNNVAGGYATTNWLDVDGGTSTTADSTHCYTPLEPYLAWMAKQIDDFGGVLEFKGTSSFATLPTGTSGDNRKGEVYILTEKLYWSSTGGADTWSTYPTNTLFVCVGTATGANYINTTNSTSGAKYQWVPLGGQNDIYATKAQAIGTITLSGSTLHVESVDGTTTKKDITIPTIGTTAASTLPITSDIPSASDSAIPNVAAVKAYAGSAGKLNTTTRPETIATAYIVAVGAQAEDAQQPWGTITVDFSGAHPYMDVDVNYAAWAGTATVASSANKLANTLTFAGGSTTTISASFDGSDPRTVRFNDGLGVSIGSNNVFAVKVNYDESRGITLGTVGLGVHVTNGISVSSAGVAAKADTTQGITVTASGIGVNKGDGLTFSNGALKVNVNASNTIKAAGDGIGLVASGVASGTYSALKVDTYGRATAGGQVVVFAPTLSSADLNALVVGGVAFVGSGETGDNSTGATSITDNIS